MKKVLFILLTSAVLLTACDRVEPNHGGILMEHFGRTKDDYHQVYGRVSTFGPDKKLFQVPLWEQRSEFRNEDGSKRILHLKSSDNTEFTVLPVYSYKVNKEDVVDVLFNNAQLAGNNFLYDLEMNVLQPKIYDITKEMSTAFTTDSLMHNSGREFEKAVEDSIYKMFATQGLTLTAYSALPDFPQKAKDKIDDRNEIVQDILVIEAQIEQQKKRNELAQYKAMEVNTFSASLNDNYLKYKWIEAWREVKQPVYDIPFTFTKEMK